VAGKSRKVRDRRQASRWQPSWRARAEIGFQQVSELIHVPGVTFVGAIPAELQQDTFFSRRLAMRSAAGGGGGLASLLHRPKQPRQSRRPTRTALRA